MLYRLLTEEASDYPPELAGPLTQAMQGSGIIYTATTQAEPAFMAAPAARGLAALGHKFAISDTSPLDPTIKISPDIGVASGLEFRPDGTVLAAGEPTRRGGSAAGVIHPTR